MTNLENAQVGDAVAYNTSRNYTRPAFSTIERITKTTIITASGRKFNKAHGGEMKSSKHMHPVARLWDVDSARDFVARRNAQQNDNGLINELQTAIAGRKNGHGDYSMTAIQRQQIQALLSSYNS